VSSDDGCDTLLSLSRADVSQLPAAVPELSRVSKIGGGIGHRGIGLPLTIPIGPSFSGGGIGKFGLSWMTLPLTSVAGFPFELWRLMPGGLAMKDVGNIGAALPDMRGKFPEESPGGEYSACGQNAGIGGGEPCSGDGASGGAIGTLVNVRA
jgi:hypothetical protein